jgi:hypothetical protein
MITCADEKVRNPAEGLTLVKQALAKAPTDAYYLDTLACAYAATGDFPNAIVTEKKALAGCDDATLRARIEKRLQGFQQGTAYVQENPVPK